MRNNRLKQIMADKNYEVYYKLDLMDYFCEMIENDLKFDFN